MHTIKANGGRHNKLDLVFIKGLIYRTYERDGLIYAGVFLEGEYSTAIKIARNVKKESLEDRVIEVLSDKEMTCNFGARFLDKTVISENFEVAYYPGIFEYDINEVRNILYNGASRRNSDEKILKLLL